ncbi:porin [Variovorax sp. PBL-E5]|uniref:porin n=1 Tax=Variovorax sp. PBL-E5 TaxID=434014 RepID=UPI0013187911|nr:porin [Variovorax sp. PBL-E5]VTU35999.1 Outer membrane porin protein 32 precursor [Variovorax sp. PBL-E5]
MKRKIWLTSVALAAAGAASAQSSITVFGTIDTAISGYSNRSTDPNGPTLLNPFYVNRGSVTTSQTALTNSNYFASRIGFRGTEDLGGGLAASFWLEAPFSSDDGQTGITTFSRRSTVSLLGGFGEIRLGRDYTATVWNDTALDPFTTFGVGTNLILRPSFALNSFAPSYTTPAGTANVTGNNYLRASNMVAYFLPPDLGGFYGQVQYAFGERTHYSPGNFTPVGAETRAGRYVGARFGWANGPINIAAAYGESTLDSNYDAGSTAKLDTFNIAGSYDFGPVKLFAELSRVKRKVDDVVAPPAPVNTIDVNGYMLGLMAPIGPGLIRASYGNVRYDTHQTVPGSPGDPRADQWALGYVHNLSKRTALYATVARIRNRNGANLSVGGPAFVTTGFVPKTSTGYDLGIRHNF